MSVARRVVVRGRVQGVYFRDSCRAEADRLGVAGTVRNRADGAVEIHAEGGGTAVDALVAWARHGPTRARVEAVEVAEVEPTGSAGFRIVG